MPEVDVVDETWLAVSPARLAPTVAWPQNWRRWWPELDIEVEELRGEQGVRWRVRGRTFRGTMEVYLQPQDDGTLAYFFLRADGRAKPMSPTAARRLTRRYRKRAKLIFWAVSDRLDPGRLSRVGTSRSL